MSRIVKVTTYKCLHHRKSTREELFKCFAEGTPVRVMFPSGIRDSVFGIIQRMEREDGSGYSYNLDVCYYGGERPVVNTTNIRVV